MQFNKSDLIHNLETIPAKLLDEAVLSFKEVNGNFTCSVTHALFNFTFPFEGVATSGVLEVGYNAKMFFVALGKTKSKGEEILLEKLSLKQGTLKEKMKKAEPIGQSLSSISSIKGALCNGKAVAKLLKPMTIFGTKDPLRTWRDKTWIEQKDQSFVFTACDGVVLNKIILDLPNKNIPTLAKDIIITDEQTSLLCKVLETLELPEFFVTDEYHIGLKVSDTHFLILNGEEGMNLPSLKMDMSLNYFTKVQFLDFEQVVEMRTKTKIVTNPWVKEFEEQLRIFKKNAGDVDYSDMTCTFHAYQETFEDKPAETKVKITGHYQEKTATLAELNMLPVSYQKEADQPYSINNFEVNAYRFLKLARGFDSITSITFFEKGVVVDFEDPVFGISLGFLYGIERPKNPSLDEESTIVH